jgi:hypothetical protein
MFLDIFIPIPIPTPTPMKAVVAAAVRGGGMQRQD